MWDAEFEQFLRESVRLTERVVHQNRCFDAGVDFTGSNSTGGKASRELMSLKQSFFDDRYSKDRTVNHLDWSPNHKELFLVAHNKRMSCTSETDDWSLSVDPDGVVLLWSINMPERPEYVFTCQSEVHSAVFYPFNPSLVAGKRFRFAGAIIDSSIVDRRNLFRGDCSLGFARQSNTGPAFYAVFRWAYPSRLFDELHWVC